MKLGSAELRSLPKPDGKPEIEPGQEHTADHSDLQRYSPREAHSVPGQYKHKRIGTASKTLVVEDIVVLLIARVLANAPNSRSS